MRNIDEIILNKVALSILDKENKNAIFPDGELELTEEAYEYFEKHILKGLKDEDAKPAKFDMDRNIVRDLCKETLEDEDTFLENGKRLAQYLYKCMENDEKEVSGDVAICQFEAQSGKYLAIMKLNFTNTYCHFAKEVDGNPSIAITTNKTGLPGLAQKPSKAVFIKTIADNCEYDMLILDKQPEGYFTQAFVKCSPARDKRENTKIICRASESFARKVFRDNAQGAESFRKRLADYLRTEDELNIDKIAEESFEDNAIGNEYKAMMLSEGITEKAAAIDNEWARKKLKRKRLKVDKDIELYIDVNAYKDAERFEVKRNGDGTIDIVIKRIRNYIEK